MNINEKVIETEEISKSFDEELFKDFSINIANDERIAEDLVLALWKYIQGLANSPDATIQLDTTENNPHAGSFARKLGFRKIFNTARMYHGIKPPMEEEKVYGLTSLEIG